MAALVTGFAQRQSITDTLVGIWSPPLISSPSRALTVAPPKRPRRLLGPSPEDTRPRKTGFLICIENDKKLSIRPCPKVEIKTAAEPISVI